MRFDDVAFFGVTVAWSLNSNPDVPRDMEVLETCSGRTQSIARAAARQGLASMGIDRAKNPFFSDLRTVPGWHHLCQKLMLMKENRSFGRLLRAIASSSAMLRIMVGVLETQMEI